MASEFTQPGGGDGKSNERIVSSTSVAVFSTIFLVSLPSNRADIQGDVNDRISLVPAPS